MKPKIIKYQSGYKYQLIETYYEQTSIYPPNDVTTRFYSIYQDGRVVVRTGYAWDGPSGPAIDTKNFMRGSLIHDVICQAIEEGHLAHLFREQGDKELRRICLEDGMWKVRSWWVYRAVRVAGENPKLMKPQHPVCEAP